LAAIFWFLLIGQRAEVAHGSERLGWLETAPGGQAGLHHARSAPAVRMGFTRRRSCWRGQGDPALADPALVRVALDGEIAHRNVLLSAHPKPGKQAPACLGVCASREVARVALDTA